MNMSQRGAPQISSPWYVRQTPKACPTHAVKLKWLIDKRVQLGGEADGDDGDNHENESGDEEAVCHNESCTFWDAQESFICSRNLIKLFTKSDQTADTDKACPVLYSVATEPSITRERQLGQASQSEKEAEGQEAMGR